MRIARVVGTVTLNRQHPSLAGARLRCVEPLESVEQIAAGEPAPGGDLVVMWDLVGAGEGDLVALAEGPEAAQPFRPDVKPLDASGAAILDHVDLGPP